MAYNNYNYTNQIPQPQLQSAIPQQNIQPLFPQPQGNVYNINSTLEVANVPVGAGISVALCMPENIMYIKTMQNGNPLFYPYKIVPFTNEKEQPNSENSIVEKLTNELKDCNSRIAVLEEQLSKITNKKEWNL